MESPVVISGSLRFMGGPLCGEEIEVMDASVGDLLPMCVDEPAPHFEFYRVLALSDGSVVAVYEEVG